MKITRIVWRRRRYQRRCSHPGPRTACAPPAARPVPKGLFTAGFLARLAYEKHVLGRPVHRIVQALAADGFDVAPGTLCGALKQIAPLIAPWAEAIAAHGRQAGHVHVDETSWQVFEDIADKDAPVVAVGLRHRPDDRVRDGYLPRRRCRRRPAAHRPGTITAGGRPRPGHLLGLPQGLPVAGLHRRRGPVVVLGSYPAVFPAGRGRSPRGARRLGRSVDRADRGAVPGAPRAGGHHTGHRRPPARPGPLAAGPPTSTRTVYCRTATPQRACCTRPLPRSSPRSATHGTGWPGTRSCRSCRWIIIPMLPLCRGSGRAGVFALAGAVA